MKAKHKNSETIINATGCNQKCNRLNILAVISYGIFHAAGKLETTSDRIMSFSHFLIEILVHIEYFEWEKQKDGTPSNVIAKFQHHDIVDNCPVCQCIQFFICSKSKHMLKLTLELGRRHFTTHLAP